MKRTYPYLLTFAFIASFAGAAFCKAMPVSAFPSEDVYSNSFVTFFPDTSKAKKSKNQSANTNSHYNTPLYLRPRHGDKPEVIMMKLGINEAKRRRSESKKK